MPRLPTVPREEILTVLQQFRDEVAEGIGKTTAPIWEQISKQLDKRMSPGAIYTVVKCNRYNCQSLLNIQVDSLHETSQKVADDEKIESEYTFTIPYSQWISLCSNNKLCQGWTDCFYEKVSQVCQTKCIWMFKHHNITQNGAFYMTFQGYCAECRGSLHGWIPREPDVQSGGVIFFNVNNIKSSLHDFKRKRPLAGEQRQCVGQRLCDGLLPINWRREHATKSPEKLRSRYSLEVLRTAKYNHKLKTQYSEISTIVDPMTSLHNLKYNENFYTTIHGLGLDPFHCMYWSREQLLHYNQYCKHHKDSTLYIDATGSLVNKLERPNRNKSHHIFLYAGVINLGRKDGQIPVCQMLTECQTANFISTWLNQWMTQACVPHTVVCDHSAALLSALAKGIAEEICLKSYINKCFQMAKGENHKLKTFIRIDYPHVMKSISRWRCFAGAESKKRFYMKILARLIRTTKLSDAEAIIQSLFITANSFYEGDDNLDSEKSKMFLKNLIASEGTDILEDEAEVLDDKTAADNESGEESEDLLNLWIRDIYECALVQCNSEMKDPPESYRKNVHFSPDFSTSFLKLLKTYPLWSAVMTPHMGVPQPQLTRSSAPVESYFNDLKNRSFRNDRLPIRVDKFVYKHIKEIESMMLLYKEPFKMSEPENSAKQDCENWRGLAKRSRPAVTLTKSFYAQPVPEISFLADGDKHPIGLLENGNRLNTSKPCKVDNLFYILSNTCAFDAVTQAFASAYVDSEPYRCHLQHLHSNNKLVKFLDVFTKNGPSDAVYFERVNVLKEIFEHETLRNDSLIISCATDVFTMFEKVSSNLFSAQETYTCSTCEDAVSCLTKILQVKELSDVTHLEETVGNCFLGKMCRSCGHQVSLDVSIHEQVLVDFAQGSLVYLRDIPTVVHLEGRMLGLRSVVGVVFPINVLETQMSHGHYYALCRRNDGSWETYDDLERKVNTTRDGKQHYIRAILYTV